jgi:hypothetical protein
MHAVVRETRYPRDMPIEQTPEFKEFQEIHARRPGYRGTVVVNAGDGRFLTVTLWDTADSMAAARMALEPVVERLLNPLMTAPSQLLGTGRVVVDDRT